MTYKIIQGTKGQRYLKDGKLVSKDKIPEDVLASLVDDKPVRTCAICGKVATKARLLNLQTIECCEEHYTVTLGKLAELLRKKEENAQEEKVQV